MAELLLRGDSIDVTFSTLQENDTVKIEINEDEMGWYREVTLPIDDLITLRSWLDERINEYDVNKKVPLEKEGR